jgi:hypothetical protein
LDAQEAEKPSTGVRLKAGKHEKGKYTEYPGERGFF